MRRFIVERKIAGADSLGKEEIQEIARRSKQAISGMDVPYSGVESYVEGDTVCCIHAAESAEAIYRRAREAGFPADRVTALENGDPDSLPGVLSQLRDEFGLRCQTRCNS
jgi:hypothetical protein